MSNQLYFTCPSDFLEPVIRKENGRKVYFLNALANSFEFTPEVIDEINRLVEKRTINKITFVLADNNQLIFDALNKGDFSTLKSMEGFFEELSLLNSTTAPLWQSGHNKLQVLSYYLESKTKELKRSMAERSSNEITFETKIYTRQTGKSLSIPTALFLLKPFQLN